MKSMTHIVLPGFCPLQSRLMLTSPNSCMGR